MFRSRMTGDPALTTAIGTVEREINDIVNSGQYYYSNEIAGQFSSISTSVRHLRLDNNFLKTSQAWDSNFDTRDATAGVTGVLQRLGKYLQEYKRNMLITDLENQQENQIRAIHQWAMQNLESLQQDMDVFVANAAQRIVQFGDEVGVTDRFTGYRHNLTRGSRDHFKMATDWMDKSAPQGYMDDLALARPGYTQQTEAQPRARTAALGGRIRFSEQPPRPWETKGYRTIDTLYPRSNTIYTELPSNYSNKLNEVKTQNALNASLPPVQHTTRKMAAPHGMKSLSVQEQAGINTTFPGRTEYMTKYGKPPSDVKTSDFNINPTPNFSLHQRPLGQACFEESNTEYQVRFEWPNSDKIVRTPWLRN